MTRPVSPQPALAAPAGCACSRLYRLPGDAAADVLDRLRHYVPAGQAGLFGVDPAECTGEPGAPRYWPEELLVCDPADDVTIPQAAFTAAVRHDVAVCHPMPGLSGEDGLLLALLIGLGKARDCLRRDPQRAAPAELARLWLRAHEIRHLIVLRGDHIPAPLRATLRGWISQVPATLWMVTARSAPPAGYEDIHLVSAATFADYFGCPHREQASARTAPPAHGSDGAALRAAGLFTVCDDVQRLVPHRVGELIGRLRGDLADARAALAGLMLTDGYLIQQRAPVSRRATLRQARPPGQDVLADQAAVAAAVCAFLATVAPGEAEQMIRLRALQLAFLERGWLLADAPADLALPPRPCSFGWAQAARIGLLASPVKAGLMALAYATGLPAGALASVRASDIAAPGHEVRIGDHAWAIPGPAAPFVRAIRLAAPTRLGGAEGVHETLASAARLAGVPAPALPADDCAATHPWLAGRNLRLTRLPDPGWTPPDVVELALRAAPDPVPGRRLTGGP